MARSIEQIISAFDALQAEDFDNTEDGLSKLYSLTDELKALPQPEREVPAMFEVMERLSDLDLGSPGPLVHALEQMHGHYESGLVESIRRKPTPLTLWMVSHHGWKHASNVAARSETEDVWPPSFVCPG